MYSIYDNSTDRHDQLVMMMWLGSAGAGVAMAFTAGLNYLGLL